MKLVLVAVGQRQPAWADAAFDDYAKRLPPELRLELKAVKAEPRGAQDRRAADGRRGGAHRGGAAARRAPRRARRARRARDHRAAGRRACGAWQGDGRDVALAVGGPDGLDPALKASCRRERCACPT